MIIAAMLLAAAAPAADIPEDKPVPVADSESSLIEAQTDICSLLNADVQANAKLSTAIYNTLNRRVALFRRAIRGASDPDHVTRFEENLELAVKMRGDEELRAAKNNLSIYVSMAKEGCELPDRPAALYDKEEPES